MKIRGQWLAAAFCVVVYASPVMAQSDDANQVAQDAYTQLQLQHYQEALVLYEKAYALSKEPLYLINVATCQRELNLLEEALKTYKAFLGASQDSQLREEVNKRVSVLNALIEQRNTTGTIEVTSEPKLAEVFLDGALKGQTPLTIELVSPGAHQIKVRKQGFGAFQSTVAVEAKKKFIVEAPLPAPSGTIVIKTNYLGSTALIDGRPIEQKFSDAGEVSIPGVALGAHMLTVKRDGIGESSVPFSLSTNEETKLVVATIPPSRVPNYLYVGGAGVATVSVGLGVGSIFANKAAVEFQKGTGNSADDIKQKFQTANTLAGVGIAGAVLSASLITVGILQKKKASKLEVRSEGKP